MVKLLSTDVSFIVKFQKEIVLDNNDNRFNINNDNIMNIIKNNIKIIRRYFCWKVFYQWSIFPSPEIESNWIIPFQRAQQKKFTSLREKIGEENKILRTIQKDHIYDCYYYLFLIAYHIFFSPSTQSSFTLFAMLSWIRIFWIAVMRSCVLSEFEMLSTAFAFAR